MSHRALINGTAYEITGGRVIVNGTSYSVKNGKTLISGTAYNVGFRLPEIREFPIGTSVYLNVNNVRTEFIIVHQGIPSSSYDSSCNGTWLLMRNCYEERTWASSRINAYADSDIHSYLNNTFINSFDNNVKNIIKQVRIPYSTDGSSSGVVCSGSNGLSTKIFLLSYSEVFTESYDHVRIEGSILNYFNGAPASNRICYINGNQAHWWLRSPFLSGSNVRNIGLMCYKSGEKFATGSVSKVYAIRPALILPSNTLCDSSKNIVIK